MCSVAVPVPTALQHLQSPPRSLLQCTSRAAADGASDTLLWRVGLGEPRRRKLVWHAEGGQVQVHCRVVATPPSQTLANKAAAMGTMDATVAIGSVVVRSHRWARTGNPRSRPLRAFIGQGQVGHADAAIRCPKTMKGGSICREHMTPHTAARIRPEATGRSTCRHRRGRRRHAGPIAVNPSGSNQARRPGARWHPRRAGCKTRGRLHWQWHRRPGGCS
mmetsp:Transcript_22589/g.77220  ORF Transcript_22589/g.77220 Transcript_22589/m.77220 type:complete len:219 (+) Transcript_22589:909-1565(+)